MTEPSASGRPLCSAINDLAAAVGVPGQRQGNAELGRLVEDVGVMNQQNAGRLALIALERLPQRRARHPAQVEVGIAAANAGPIQPQ